MTLADDRPVEAPAPADEPARAAIRTALTENLFVEAGAGAGKTTSLVARIVALVASGVAIESVAAITFTEKAAAELRHRVRAKLAEAVADAGDEALRQQFDTALDRLDHAPIGTLHGFARRVLNEYPIEVGLPPGFAVLDELESNMRFDDRWEELLDRLLADAAPAAGAAAGGSAFYEICTFDKFGLLPKLRTVPSGFRKVALDFQANWDLVEERVDTTPPAAWAPDLSVVMALAAEVAATTCPDGDKQAERCAEVAAAAAHLENAPTLSFQLRVLEQLSECARKASGKVGNTANWKKFGADLDALKARHAALHAACAELLTAAREHRKRLVGAILGRWVLDSAAERRADGAVAFHDLLVLARRLLSHHPHAREQLHRRFTRVLLDEFQDTDPIQLEIAVRLTADPHDPAQAGDWRELRPLPGRLFIVGDPKQSIYRFRRADIAQYLRAAEQVDASELQLNANFRSSRAVIDWVNEVFAAMIVHERDVQPAYQALQVARPGPVDHGSVRLLGVAEHEGLTAEQRREAEAADVAAIITTALAERWPVGERGPGGEPTLRDCRPGDVCVLLPSRLSLDALERALRSAGIPYRAENSSVVYVTTEIRHLVLALRAADDPTDEFSLVAALRTPLYGCSDVDLYRWRAAGGRFRMWARPPEGLADSPVASAIAHLETLARRSSRHTPADLLAALVDERRLLDAALDAPDARDVWRRVRFVVEQARAWSDAGGHGLRRYLRWVTLQASESRSADTVLPEHDHDAVRIMTVHAAKGLEFPITILSGNSTKPKGPTGYSVVWPGESWTLTEKGDPAFDEYSPIDDQMSDAERRRLLYVACTRAVDHLVVSLHREPPGPTAKLPDNAQLLVACGALTAAHAAAWEGRAVPVAGRATAAPSLEWADLGEWRAERDRVRAAASPSHSISATTLAAAVPGAMPDSEPEVALDTGLDTGLDKDPVDLDLPPWRRGRYGTAVGRAVHAVLQFCDLERGSDIEHHAAAQCAAEGILGMDDLVARLARSAIAAPVVQTALAVRHHRELFVAAPVADRVLEGYIDLFVETPEGGLIVDYKTDQWFDDPSGRELREQRIAKYRTQLAAYAVALERITGVAPAGGVLVRCRPDGPAEEIHLPGWPDAIAATRAAVGRVV